MARRIYTATELDALVNPDTVTIVSIDAPSGYIESAVLVGVYTDGRFEVVFDKDGETYDNLYDLRDVKVYVAD